MKFCYYILLGLFFWGFHSSQGLAQSNSYSPLVFGGKVFSEPAQKAATVYLSIDYGTSSCSGSYIGSSYVVTAAHCSVNAHPTISQVYFIYMNGDEIVCDVKEIISHPDYDEETVINDVAVWKVQCTDPRVQEIQPYLLDENSTSPHDLYSLGYGRTSLTEYDHPYPQLKVLEEETLDLSDVINNDKYLNDDKYIQAYKHVLSLVESGKITCFKSNYNLLHGLYFGDSGGPTAYLNSDQNYVLYGVNSFISRFYIDYKTASDEGMSCVANVSYYADWIKQVTGR
ncbi:MAG: trypsin-like serine protease [Bdellovibrionales bacterium]|nr:trypsin-like serine protease [Bdellovibrionales bacterium]